MNEILEISSFNPFLYKQWVSRISLYNLDEIK